MRLVRSNHGARNRATASSEPKKVPKTTYVFGDSMSNQTRVSLHPSSIQTVTVGSGVPPDHAHLVILSGCEGSARGLYHRSGITPCPEGFYLVVEIIPFRTQI